MEPEKTFNIKIAIVANRLTPHWVKRSAAFLLSRLMYYLSPKHRLIAIHNLIRAFPEKSLDDILNIVKASNENFILSMLEFPDLLNVNKDNIHRLVSIKGLEHYEAACREGKGVLLFSAHFGSWEVGNAALAILSKPPVFMARILDSAFLEEGSTYVRATLGIGNIHKENAMRPLLRLLKKGEAVKLLIDQNVAVYEGVFVDYFGRTACTTTGIALLALHTGAAVLPIFTTRMPDGKYVTEIGPKVETVNTGDRDQDVRINTQNYTKVIEDHVRQYPHQWLWVHQRWKTKPCQAERNS